MSPNLVRVVGVCFEDAEPNAVEPSGCSRHSAEVWLGGAEAAVEARVVVVWLSGRDGRKGQCRVTHLVRVRVRVSVRVRVRVRVRARARARVRPVRRARTVAASTPVLIMVDMVPRKGTRPKVAASPTVPDKAAGIRMLPPAWGEGWCWGQC